MENKKMEIDVNKLVLDVYNKIANWHNTDFNNNRQKGDALKIVSHDIVQDLFETIFSEMGLNTRMEVKRGDTEIVQAKEEIKDFGKTDGKDIFNEIFINKKKD